MNKDTSPPPRNTRPKRSFTVTVGLSTVISGILLLSAGFVAVFSLGVLLGRGYNLEANIPELERIMPQPRPTSAPLVIAEDDDERAGSASEDGNRAERDEAGKNATASGIIEPGELAYPDSLKTPAPVTRQPAKPPESKPQAQAAPSGANGAKTAEQPKAKSAAAGQNAASTRAAAAGAYHYVYQAAAYKDKPSCDRFVAKLTGAGFRARTARSQDNGVTWYRALVDFTGKPDDTDQLREKLKKHGVPRVIMKSKEPAR